jgi:hypothetical protein
MHDTDSLRMDRPYCFSWRTLMAGYRNGGLTDVDSRLCNAKRRRHGFRFWPLSCPVVESKLKSLPTVILTSCSGFIRTAVCMTPSTHTATMFRVDTKESSTTSRITAGSCGAESHRPVQINLLSCIVARRLWPFRAISSTNSSRESADCRSLFEIRRL